MKKFLSVVMLSSRHIVNKLLLLLFIMIAAETLSFYFFGIKTQGTYVMSINSAHLLIIYLIALTACCFICMSAEAGKGKQEYLRWRLSVSSRAIDLAGILVNTMALLTIHAIQIILLFAFWHLYQVHGKFPGAEVTLFADFLTDPGLNYLFPVNNGGNMVIRILTITGLAVACRKVCCDLIRGKKVGAAASVIGIYLSRQFFIYITGDFSYMGYSGFVDDILVIAAAMIIVSVLMFNNQKEDENE